MLVRVAPNGTSRHFAGPPTSLIGLSGSSAFRLSTTAASMSDAVAIGFQVKLETAFSIENDFSKLRIFALI